MATSELKEFKETLDSKEGNPDDLIETLQDIQERYGYLDEFHLKEVSVMLEVPLIEVFRVANFYKAFRLQPCGKHLITVCTGTACHVRGAARLVEETLTRLKIDLGETTVDNLFTVETVNCLGACALGPVIVMDGKYYNHMTPRKLKNLLDKVSRDGTG